jgi:hypothetical protein
MKTTTQSTPEQPTTAGCVRRLVRVAELVCRILALAIASIFLLPFIGIVGLWDEWKSEIEMIRNGY